VGGALGDKKFKKLHCPKGKTPIQNGKRGGRVSNLKKEQNWGKELPEKLSSLGKNGNGTC